MTGQGTLLSKQDAFSVNVQTVVVGGVASYSGQLSFSDKSVGDTFTAATITSVQIIPIQTPTAGIALTEGYFIITGTATLNNGTSAAYNFTATGSLPVAGNPNSTGGLEFQVSGPNGFSYSSPWKAWDSGETVAITLTA